MHRNNNSSNTTVYNKEDHGKRLFEDCEIPKGLREPFIKSRYRRAYSTPWECFKSLFYINNESFNVWSHILATCFFVVRYAMAAFSQAPTILDPFNWPLFASAIGTLTLYSTSSIAHLLNCMSERGYKTCFFFDYAAVSLYTFTSSQAMFFYIRPMDTNWLIFQSPSLFLCLSALFSFLTTYGCCQTGALVHRFSTLLRALPVLGAWLNSTLPFTVGVTLCSCHVSSTSCTAFSPCRSEPLSYYFGHAFCTILAGFMYSTRLPERLLPGKFDLVGNSHHFLHICVALATEFAFKLIEFDIKHKNAWKKRENVLEESTSDVTLLNTVGAAILVMFINAAIALWFSRALRENETVSKKKQ